MQRFTFLGFYILHHPHYNKSENRNIMGWLQLIVQKLIQPFFHHLPGQHLSWTSSLSSDSNLETTGWCRQRPAEMGVGNWTAIMTDTEGGPPDLLKVIRCGCKGPCGNSYSCRNAGLNCASTCKECHGITCINAPVIVTKVEEVEYERNFLGKFWLVQCNIW